MTDEEHKRLLLAFVTMKLALDKVGISTSLDQVARDFDYIVGMADAAKRSLLGKHCYLMRGIAAAGKSHMAKRLAGVTGHRFEVDEFFIVDGEYQFDSKRVPEARAWNLARFKKAVDRGYTPLVVDRGNNKHEDAAAYAKYAHAAGYKVEFAEPDSPWWQEIRVLLKHKRELGSAVKPILKRWAEVLAEKQRHTHHVKASKIYKRLKEWNTEVTIDDLLNL